MIRLWQFLLLIFVHCSSCFGGYALSVCAIFQDEAPYLKEWIEFHKLQGVQHFYLYNNNSGDDYRKILEPYVQKEEVTVTDWSLTYNEGNHDEWIAIQTGAYMDCIRNYGESNRWIAFIDIDEYLFCTKGESLPLFLKDYVKYGGVGVNWLMFGTSHIEELPPGTLLIECLTFCAKRYYWENRFYKSIVQPRYVLDCPCAHSFLYKQGTYAVDSRKKRIQDGYRAPDVLLNRIRIHHYCMRTEKYLREKKIPSRLKRRPEYTPDICYALAEQYNERYDMSILQFVSLLRKFMIGNDQTVTLK